ncbi:hypothetical protein L218DRAFT_1075070 [Marasmius fiardii PR-910]|nr:hypothetical protein L218DRAFT_1075070 [Marasmius fiardii PR-910]
MLDDSHPLTLEIDSLRSAVARFQDEAHNASVKLQRFSFDSSNAQDRIYLLERENEVLRHELDILRTNPHPDSTLESHPAAQRSQELTLTLRKLSDKLSLTEQALQSRTSELAHANSEVTKSRAAIEGAYALAAQIRGREEEGKVRERDLERRIMEAEEETKMSDLVVNEYADLVRSLEGRRTDGPPSNSSAGTMVDGLSQGKLGLQRLFNDFTSESEKLQAEVTRLQGALAEAESRCEAERKGAEADRVLLAQTQHELETLRLEDKTASKMVSRYMQFSQVSTNALQVSLNTLQTRHSATIDTLTSQITDLSRQLHSSEATAEKLRTTLDELGRDIMREAFGRRREIALRLRLVTREQVLNDGLERLVRRLSEASEKQQVDADILGRILEDSQALLASVSGSEEVNSEMGSLARIVAAENAVRGLIEELGAEKERRLFLETQSLIHGQQKVMPQNGSANGHIDHTEPEKSLPQTPAEKPAFEVHNSDLASPLPSSASSPAPAPPAPEGVSSREEQLPTLDPVSIIPAGFTIPVLESRVEEEIHEIILPPKAETSPKIASSTTDTLTSSIPQSVVPQATLSLEVDIPPSQVSPPSETSKLFEATVFVDSDHDTTLPVPLPLVAKVEPVPAEQIETSPVPENPHPLLAELHKVSKRYDDLQRAFRDCHLALQGLRKQKSGTLPEHLFQTAVDRLDDYTEDARVELEIRVADEALMMQGYETMLSLPSTVSTPILTGQSSIHSRTVSEELGTTTPTRNELETQIHAFVSGSDPVVHKARQKLEHKLADVQHDIAKLKLVIYEESDTVEQSEVDHVPSPSPSQKSGWASWLSSSPSRPSASTPAPTFGDVMTTPRLRHASSINRLRQRQFSATKDDNTFSSLGLKIAMPSIGSSSSGFRVASFSQHSSPSPTQRNRTVSMLGLGGGPARGPGVSTVLSPSSVSLGSLSRSTSTYNIAAVESGSDEEIE